MKRSRFTQQQILQILKACEEGGRVADLCATYGVSSSTIYSWKMRFAARATDGAERQSSLEIENRRLKERLEELSLAHENLKGELRRLRNHNQEI